MATNQPTKTLAHEDGQSVNTTISALPLKVWKLVHNEATARRVSAKAIWIEMACEYFRIENCGGTAAVIRGKESANV